MPRDPTLIRALPGIGRYTAGAVASFAFDLPEPLVSQGSRPTTTVAPQALMLMNGPQVREWAEAFATRMEMETGDEARIARAYVIALGRAPRAQEAESARAFVAAQTASRRPSSRPGTRSSPRSWAPRVTRSGARF
jgi:hypothetical protein